MSKLTERLDEALGIHNEYDFARVGEAETWIDYRTGHAHAQGYSNRRAVVHFVRDGKRLKKVIRERGGSAADDREACVQAAFAFVSKALDLEIEWVAGPFLNSWMPRDVRERVMAKLKAAEEGR